jgi:hypothetical protein
MTHTHIINYIFVVKYCLICDSTSDKIMCVCVRERDFEDIIQQECNVMSVSENTTLRTR